MTGFLFYFRRLIISLWREPVFGRPVLIVESDDWGPVDAFGAERLGQIVEVLKKHIDSKGRHPVMTIGLVLSVPDTEKIRGKGANEIDSLFLDDARFKRIRDTLIAGEAEGVFALQLHGMAHYLPETVLKGGESDEQVKKWLIQDGIPDPIDLPPALQSRWIDGSRLPSRSLDHADSRIKAAEEVDRFREICGKNPAVAVPPTFIWTEAVEEGWESRGVKYIVTPGRQYIARDQSGRPVRVAGNIRNGDKTTNKSISYLVRDVYFEPSYGHRAESAVKAASVKWKQGRPALTETHRFNFTGSAEEQERSLKELDQLIRIALRTRPDLWFISTEALGNAMVTGDERMIVKGFMARMPFFLHRTAAELPLVRRIYSLCSS